MKTMLLKRSAWAFALIALLGIAAIASAGQQKGDQTKAATVEKEFRETVRDLKKYSAEQRDLAVREVKKAMDDLNTQIDKMNADFEHKRDRMDKAGREKAGEQLKALRKKSNDLAEWYGALKHSSADAWEKVKKGFAESYEILSKSLDDAARELRSSRESK